MWAFEHIGAGLIPCKLARALRVDFGNECWSVDLAAGAALLSASLAWSAVAGGHSRRGPEAPHVGPRRELAAREGAPGSARLRVGAGPPAGDGLCGFDGGANCGAVILVLGPSPLGGGGFVS